MKLAARQKKTMKAKTLNLAQVDAATRLLYNQKLRAALEVATDPAEPPCPDLPTEHGYSTQMVRGQEADAAPQPLQAGAGARSTKENGLMPNGQQSPTPTTPPFWVPTLGQTTRGNSQP